MSNIFQEILDKLRENEKDLLIKKSGSTRDNNNERIRFGQSYLYKMRKMESEVLEIRLYKKVRGDYLNQALREAIEFITPTDKLIKRSKI